MPEHDTKAGPGSHSDVILLDGIEVPAALGVSAAERRMRRPVRVDLEVGRDLRAAGRSDRIKDTLDYALIYEVVEEVAGGREHRLVEALGENLAVELLGRFEIEWVTVTVRKPKPVAGVLDYTGIRITRRRGA
jgi:dihydroneopterin aldolase